VTQLIRGGFKDSELSRVCGAPLSRANTAILRQAVFFSQGGRFRWYVAFLSENACADFLCTVSIRVAALRKRKTVIRGGYRT